MSFDKAIKYGKEKRKKYYKSGAFDMTCRPGGTCPYCISNRKYKNEKRKQKANDKLIYNDS